MKFSFLFIFLFVFSARAQECTLDELEHLRDEVGCEMNFLSSYCSSTALGAAAAVGAVKTSKLSPEDLEQAKLLEKSFQEMSKDWRQFRAEHQKILREYFKILKEKKLTPNSEANEMAYKDLEPHWNELQKRVGPSRILDTLKYKAQATHGRDVRINDVLQNFGSDLFNKFLSGFTGRFRTVFVRLQGHLTADELFQSRIDFQQSLSKAFRQFADSATERITRIRSGGDFADNKADMKELVRGVSRVGVNLRPIRTAVKAGAAGVIGGAAAFAEAGIVIDASSKIASCVEELKVPMTNPARFRMTEYARSRPLVLGMKKTSCDQVQLDLSILDAIKAGEYPDDEAKQVQSFLCAYMKYRKKGTQYQIKEQEPVSFYPSLSQSNDGAATESNAYCDKVKIAIGKSNDKNANKAATQYVTLPWSSPELDWNWNDISSDSKVCQQTIQQRLVNNPTLPVYQRHNLFHPNLVCSYPQDDCLVAVCRLSRFLQSHSETRVVRSAYCQSLKTEPAKVGTNNKTVVAPDRAR